MTLILGAKCLDGVVLAGDRKVVYEDGRIEYRDKLFCDYFPTAIGVAGSEILYTKFRPVAMKAAQELSGRDVYHNTSGEIRLFPIDGEGGQIKAILIGKYLEKLEEIVHDINKTYSARVGDVFQLLFAVQTTDGGARLHYISEKGAAQDINEYKVIGSSEIFSRIFLTQLWHKGMTMKEFAEIAYFVIKYIEHHEIDTSVGVGTRKPQVWKIPDTGLFELHMDETLTELEAHTQERLSKQALFMAELFQTPPVTDKLGYLKRGADRTTYRFETFLERVGQTGQTVRKIRLLHPDKMLEKCRILFNGTPLVWDGVNSTTKTVEAGGGGNVVVPDNIFNESAIVLVESGGDVIRKVNYTDLEMVEP